MIQPLIITTDDLLDFHRTHIKGTPLGLERFDEPAIIAPEPQEEVLYEPIEEDDGLGYYADGTKRTLTDKQIAFFRSSELRKRVVASQNKRNSSNRIASSAAKREAGIIRESVEETKAFTPIANSSSNYTSLFGEYSDYILKLDQGMDDRYIEVARRQNITDYYPVLPLHELWSGSATLYT